MTIDLRSLHYFVAVAEELNFSKAADRLNISQPPLSLAIKQLEMALDVKLFERTSRKVSLTNEGMLLYKEALFLLSYSSSLKEQLAQSVSSVPLRVGFVGSMMYRGLAELMLTLREQYPDINFELFEANSRDIIYKVEVGHLDLGFIHSNKLPMGVIGEAIFEEPFVLCVNQKTPSLKKRNTVELMDLKENPFVFFSRDASPSYYEILLSLCIGSGFFPRRVAESNNWLGILSLVSQSFGVSIVPQCMKQSKVPNLKFLDFEHSQRSITSLIWSERRTNQVKSRTMQSILEFYKTYTK